MTIPRRVALAGGVVLLLIVVTVLYFQQPPTLEKLTEKVAYSLTTVRQTGLVPRRFVDDLEPGLAGIEDANERKELFLRIMLPIVLRQNERVGKKQVLPVSLVLAQAALESGWGTARFAIEGNALFGQRTYSEAAEGIVPSGAEGQFRVKAFASLQESVAGYFNNLNTHPRYEDFRIARKALLAKEARLDPFKVIPHLKAYSEEGADYLAKISLVIKSNDFHVFDDVRLAP